jgi:hypothetical protein
MKLGKMVVATVAITIFDTIVGFLTCGGAFNWVYKLEPVSVWKPMEAPGAMYYVGTIVLNFIFVLVYAALRKGIPGNNRVVKGLMFGLCVWAVGVLPGMFVTHMFMTVAPTVIIYWAVLALVQSPLRGLISASIYGK